MHNVYRIGNAQSIGSYHIQSNYFSTINGNCAMAVLADGTIDHINGRRCAILAVEICLKRFYSKPAQEDLFEFFDSITMDILKEMREFIYLGKMPNLSLSLLVIQNKELFYYTVGNNRVFLYDGKDYKYLKERKGQAAFGNGMTVGLISSGVWEVLHEKEIIFYLKHRKEQHPFDKAQHMLFGVIEKNRKIAGNATVILVEDAL